MTLSFLSRDAWARRPASNECDAYYHRYTSLVPDDNVIATLEREFPRTRALLETVPSSRESWTYDAGKWTIREVVGHLADTERVLAGRALWIARDPATALPSLEQNVWASNSNAQHRPLSELLDEWASVRAATITLLRSFDPDALMRVGTASGMRFTVRIFAWIIAGHELHHRKLLQERYGLEARDIQTPRARAARFFDLSHVVEDGMITYKGLPAPVICDYLSREASRSRYADGTEFHIGKIEMVANTGTYLDSPFHRYADGKDLSELPLACMAGLDGIVVRPNGADGRAIDASAFRGLDIRGKAVLVRTGWDMHWRTDQYFEGHPFLTRDAAEYLAGAGAALVGIDSLNIDDIADLRRPVHSILLGAEIPIVEHMRGLEQLPETGFRFFAVPPKVKAFGTFPVRAFATT